MLVVLSIIPDYGDNVVSWSAHERPLAPSPTSISASFAMRALGHPRDTGDEQQVSVVFVVELKVGSKVF